MLPVLHSSVVTGSLTKVDLTRPHNLIVGVHNELVPVSHPARHPGQSKQDCKELGWEAHCLIDDTGVEVNVRVELTCDEVLICESNSLKLCCNLYQLERSRQLGLVNEIFVAQDFENFICKLLHNAGPRVIVLVDAMAEAHQNALLALDLVDKVRNVGD